MQIFAGRYARIGVISSANAVMTYMDTSTGTLLTRHYTASSDTWSAAEKIATGIATDYEVALNASGDAAVVFRDSSN